MVDRPQLRDRRPSREGDRPMIPTTAQESCLTEETKAVIWRIFGEGASPQTQRSPYQLIEPVLKKRLSSNVAGPTIAAVRAWFESHGDRQWIKADVSETVATMILEGIGAARGETEIWAVGSIDAKVTVQIIRSLWSAEEIDSFVESAISLAGRVQQVGARSRRFSSPSVLFCQRPDHHGRWPTQRKAGNLPAARQPWFRRRPPSLASAGRQSARPRG